MLERYLDKWNSRVTVPAETKKSYKVFLGYEFEVIKKDDCIRISDQTSQEIIEALTAHNLLCKHDGSVYAEFVSLPLQPANCIWHLKKTADLLSETFPYFDAWKGGKCGLHIHINRKSVKSKKNLFRFFLTYKEVFQTLSGRVNTYYCSFGDYELERNFYNPSYARRYSALNFKNKSTIEFRLWRGTLNPDTLEMYVKVTATLGRLSLYLNELTISEFLFLCDCDKSIMIKLGANIANLLTSDQISDIKQGLERLDFEFKKRNFKKNIKNLLKIKREKEEIKRLHEEIKDPVEFLKATSN